jgi:hypothetical protein
VTVVAAEPVRPELPDDPATTAPDTAYTAPAPRYPPTWSLPVGAQDLSGPAAVATHASDVPLVPLARRASDHDRPQPETEVIDCDRRSGPSAATRNATVEAAEVVIAPPVIVEAGAVWLRTAFATMPNGVAWALEASSTAPTVSAATTATPRATSARGRAMWADDRMIEGDSFGRLCRHRSTLRGSARHGHGQIHPF